MSCWRGIDLRAKLADGQIGELGRSCLELEPQKLLLFKRGWIFVLDCERGHGFSDINPINDVYLIADLEKL